MVFIGTGIMAIGLDFLILSGQGVDPLSTFLDGLTKFVSIQLGTMITVFNFSLLLLILLVDSKYIGIGSFINGIFLGVFSNALLPIMTPLTELPAFLLVLFGLLFFPIGISLYMNMDLGLGSLEALMMIISDKVTANMAIVRTLLDVFFIVIGILLGASFGYGSVFSALLNGKLISFFSAKLNQFLKINT